MSLVSLKELLETANKNNFAVGYFEAWDLYSLEAVALAAEKENSPIVLGFGGMTVNQEWINSFGIEPLGRYANELAKSLSVPAAVYLNEVYEIDHAKRRISLGRKQCLENPWKIFADNNNKGDVAEGKIKNLTDFGIFVELSNDLDGLIHLSDISWSKSGEEAIKNYKVDDSIKFKILEIDLEKERVSLGIKQLTDDPNKSDELLKKTVTGIIEKIEKDKIFVNFDDNKNGFIKRTNLAKSKNEQNTDRFAVKEKLDAKVIKKSNKDNLYELSVKDLEIQQEKEALKEYGSSSSGASIGDIIGAALDQNKDTKKNQKKSVDEKE